MKSKLISGPWTGYSDSYLSICTYIYEWSKTSQKHNLVISSRSSWFWLDSKTSELLTSALRFVSLHCISTALTNRFDTLQTWCTGHLGPISLGHGNQEQNCICTPFKMLDLHLLRFCSDVISCYIIENEHMMIDCFKPLLWISATAPAGNHCLLGSGHSSVLPHCSLH